MKNNYFISKDTKTGEIVYLEYHKDGYTLKPKVKKEDAIEVNKIVFVSPTLTEKLLTKKINHKISKLLLELNTFYDDDNTDEGGARLRDKLKEAETLRQTIINNYRQYLNGEYTSLTLKKLQIIIDGYKSRQNALAEKRQRQAFMDMLARANYADYQNEKRGKGR